jgi:hypothetical protein
MGPVINHFPSHKSSVDCRFHFWLEEQLILASDAEALGEVCVRACACACDCVLCACAGVCV